MFHWDNRPPSSQGEQQPPHRCYVKCPLAVISLGHQITGPGSSYEPVGREEGRCPSSCGFTKTHICSRSTEDAQMATEETATREWRESVCWRLPLNWQQPVEPSIRCWQRPPPSSAAQSWPRTAILWVGGWETSPREKLRLLKQVCKIYIVTQQRNVNSSG